MKVGVIDIGTLKVKFLVGNLGFREEFQTIYQSNTLTRLGVRMHLNNNRPFPRYLSQTIKELKRCKKIVKKEKIEKIRVVSTHALREMGEKGWEIAEQIRKEVGFNVEIISQDAEAELFFNAVIKDFKTDRDFAVVDVGGGSVQIVIGNKKKMKNKYLLKTGPTYLFDKFKLSREATDFSTFNEIKTLQKYIAKETEVLPA